MKQNSVAVVGAAETTKMGKIPDVSVIGLHADAALNAMAYADGTSVGGCSFMLHVRHAAAAINAGLAKTILITHGESGRSRVGAGGFGRAPSSLMGQFEMPYGVTSPPTMFTVPVLRYMKTYGVTEEDLGNVAVVQREWAALNPRASFKDPITVDDVLNSPMIAWPFRMLMCCLVTDGGGALILTSADRARDFPQKPVYVLGTGESVETPMVSQMYDFTSSTAFKISGKKAFDEAGITHADVDHLMIYDAFAHLPLYGLEDLGFCKPGEAKDFIRERNTAIGGKLPLNTNHQQKLVFSIFYRIPAAFMLQQCCAA